MNFKFPQLPIGKTLAITLVLSFLALATLPAFGLGFLGCYMLFMPAVGWFAVLVAILQDRAITKEAIEDMHVGFESLLQSEPGKQ